MRSLLLFIFTCVLLVILTTNVFSANPADLTSNHRTFVSEFIKIGYDGGPRFLCFNLPAGKTASICVFNWQDKKGDNSLTELFVAKSIKPWLDVALDTTFAGESPVHNLAIDVRYKIAGLGMIFPLSFEDAFFGPRFDINNLSVFLTASTAKDTKNICGVSYILYGVAVEVAYGGEKLFFRTSKGFSSRVGTLIPEIRTSFSKEEKKYGFALGLIPKL